MTVVTIKRFFKKIDVLDKGLVIIFVLGLAVSFVSLFRGILMDRQVQVEYVSGGENIKTEKIFIDIEGAVIKPGVYQLLGGSRIKDVLVSAGGMSEKADREYCEKNINLAEIVKDGEKIYVPFKGAAPAAAGYVQAGSEVKKININTASVAELDTLVGVGASRSETIVKNRPYKNLEEVVSKGGMTKTIFEKNKAVLSVF